MAEEDRAPASSKVDAMINATLGSEGDGVKENGSPDGVREVSASTVGRMLGLATVTELNLMEGKIDLMSNRVNNLSIRMEKVLNLLNAAPTGSDLERIDVQIASLRTLIRDSFASLGEKGEAVEGGGLKKRLSGAIRATDSKEASSEDSDE